MYQRYVKRCGDFALSLIGVIVLMPVFLLLSLWVKLDSKGPV
ncbi:MAG: sugar transferase, partial [Oscillospiraceae bacterium]|nr:sugar transferase [Oscillospiraceae bacterium]